MLHAWVFLGALGTAGTADGRPASLATLTSPWACAVSESAGVLAFTERGNAVRGYSLFGGDAAPPSPPLPPTPPTSPPPPPDAPWYYRWVL